MRHVTIGLMLDDIHRISFVQRDKAEEMSSCHGLGGGTARLQRRSNCFSPYNYNICTLTLQHN